MTVTDPPSLSSMPEPPTAGPERPPNTVLQEPPPSVINPMGEPVQINPHHPFYADPGAGTVLGLDYGMPFDLLRELGLPRG